VNRLKDDITAVDYQGEVDIPLDGSREMRDGNNLKLHMQQIGTAIPESRTLGRLLRVDLITLEGEMSVCHVSRYVRPQKVCPI